MLDRLTLSMSLPLAKWLIMRACTRRRTASLLKVDVGSLDVNDIPPPTLNRRLAPPPITGWRFHTVKGPITGDREVDEYRCICRMGSMRGAPTAIFPEGPRLWPQALARECADPA